VSGGRRCATCGAMSDRSVTSCWSCGNPLVTGEGAVVTQPFPGPVQAPAHRTIGLTVWTVCFALLSITIFAVWWLSRGPESVDFPTTLDGLARTEEDPFDQALQDVYEEIGVSLNMASWGNGDYTAYVARHPTEGAEAGLASWAASVQSDLTAPIAERSVDGVTIRCYQAGGQRDQPDGQSQAWCGWIDGDELGILLHEVSGQPPLAQTEQVLRSVKGWT
jgi:hypothetical protein